MIESLGEIRFFVKFYIKDVVGNRIIQFPAYLNDITDNSSGEFNPTRYIGRADQVYVYSGYSIPPNYDSMIAKLITTAQTREEAINKMKRALDEFIIEGIKTTIPFHRQLMEHPDYIAGNYTTKFMEDFVMKPEEKN
ncbi:hypothetical protein [uncultured Dokdonia sp.]|uniref:hypothetical protein n=1 Tax=uncultured Dokdonia sp. TaxID=575653 RepID=UPI00261EEBEA|nr:hypothetical protein [uncultured Dokdonia sp.]